MKIFASAFIVLMVFLNPFSPAFANPHFHTEEGILEGAEEDGLLLLKGVPFAAPPVGEFRWIEPQPVKPWTGVRPARAFSPICPQSAAGMPSDPQSEDCLYLNIWAPAKKSTASLPVLVWIYGGGFTHGSGSMPSYFGEQLARRDVVVVTLNYRVGVLGFFAHPALTQESPNHASGNYGLLDQVAALHWIHRNIAAVGGDPDRITIFGQSSGASSVSLLMASPLAKDLFQAAIGESGGAFPPQTKPGFYEEGAEHEGEKFAESVRAPSLAALRNMSADALSKAPWSPHYVIDGYFLREPARDAYVHNRQNDVPILIGSNADEGLPLSSMTDRVITAESFPKDVTDYFGAKVFKSLSPAYSYDNDDHARRSFANLIRDIGIGHAVRSWAQLQIANSDKKAFYYYFAHSPPYPADSYMAGAGAAHGAEIQYVFDHLRQDSFPWTEDDRAIADDMVRYWTDFAKFHDPNGPGLATWRPYDGTEKTIMAFGSPSEIQARGAMTHPVGDSLPRIVIGGAGEGREFRAKETEHRFVPQGVNWVALTKGNIRTSRNISFDDDFYKPNKSKIHDEIRKISSLGFNFIRVRLDAKGIAGSKGSVDLNQAYMDNLIDFIRTAAQNGVYTELTGQWMPGNYYKIVSLEGLPEPRPDSSGINQLLLSDGLIEAYGRYLADVLAGIKKADPSLLSAIFYIDLWNELSFDSDHLPFSRETGVYSADSGEHFDLADKTARQMLADEATIRWINGVISVAKRVDPDALFASSIFSPHEISRPGYGGVYKRDARWGDPRQPFRLLTIEKSNADILEVHLYPHEPGAKLDEDLESIEYSLLSFRKPMVLAETGVDKSEISTPDTAADVVRSVLAQACAHHFAGWAYWTWNSDEQTDLWNLQENRGMLADRLAPGHFDWCATP